MENLQEEIWLPIPEYEGLYDVSNWGRVRSFFGKGKSERILSVSKSQHGYYRVGLSCNLKLKTHPVHKLVAITFLGHKPCGWKIVIDHIDGNRLNNNVSNLQIVTHRENISICHRCNKNDTSSTFIGVFYNNSRSKWTAKIQLDKKVIHLGHFDDEKTAGLFYRTAYDNLDKYKTPQQFRIIIYDLLSYDNELRIKRTYGAYFHKRDNRWITRIYLGNGRYRELLPFGKETEAMEFQECAYNNSNLYNGDRIDFINKIKDILKEKESV